MCARPPLHRWFLFVITIRRIHVHLDCFQANKNSHHNNSRVAAADDNDGGAVNGADVQLPNLNPDVDPI